MESLDLVGKSSDKVEEEELEDLDRILSSGSQKETDFAEEILELLRLWLFKELRNSVADGSWGEPLEGLPNSVADGFWGEPLGGLLASMVADCP